jgi:phosphoesterase RecJ-like protein
MQTQRIRPDKSPLNNQPGADFLSAIRKVRRPVIVGHVTPDADCLGSSLGLCMALRGQGVEARLGLPEGIAQRLSFMLDLAGEVPRIESWPPKSEWDSIIIVDTAGQKRINMNPAPELSDQVESFNIDHHITNPDFAKHNWVDPHAASTCEMIARLLDEWTIVPSPQVASLLYAGIHGDTAGFSLPSTSADCLRIAAQLVQAGADVTHIGEQLCRSQGRHDFELLRRVYDHTTIAAGGRIAYSFLTYEDITESGCSAQDIDDQVSIPRALKGVAIAMLFSEGERGVVRINLRGEGKLAVLELAQRFGGGGHHQSAGVRMKNKPMNAVIEEVMAAAIEHLDKASA